MKFPAQPLSSTGPFNRPADWTAAEAALDRAILAAQRAVKQEWAFDYTNGKHDYKDDTKESEGKLNKIPPQAQEWVSTYELQKGVEAKEADLKTIY